MRSPGHTLKAAMATIISLWMAVLACFMGRALPALANSGSIHSLFHADSIQKNVAEESQPGPIADMESCPHHSGGKVPGKPSDREPVPGGRMSCCPLEITVAPKWDMATLEIVPARDLVLASHFDLVTVRFYSSVELVPSVWHSGRDTLLQTRLLRV
jgi:hypothetical protein